MEWHMGVGLIPLYVHVGLQICILRMRMTGTLLTRTTASIRVDSLMVLPKL